MPNKAGSQALGSIFYIKNPHRPIAGGEKYVNEQIESDKHLEQVARRVP